MSIMQRQEPPTETIPLIGASMSYSVHDNIARCFLKVDSPPDYFVRIRTVVADPQVIAESSYKRGVHSVAFEIKHRCSVTVRVHQCDDNKIVEDIPVAVAHITFWQQEERTGRAAHCTVIEMWRMTCTLKEGKEKHV